MHRRLQFTPSRSWTSRNRQVNRNHRRILWCYGRRRTRQGHEFFSIVVHMILLSSIGPAPLLLPVSILFTSLNFKSIYLCHRPKGVIFSKKGRKKTTACKKTLTKRWQRSCARKEALCKSAPVPWYVHRFVLRLTSTMIHGAPPAFQNFYRKVLRTFRENKNIPHVRWEHTGVIATSVYSSEL